VSKSKKMMLTMMMKMMMMRRKMILMMRLIRSGLSLTYHGHRHMMLKKLLSLDLKPSMYQIQTEMTNSTGTNSTWPNPISHGMS